MFVEVAKSPGEDRTEYCVSSIDPWHSADDVNDSGNYVHSGFDLFFASGLLLEQFEMLDGKPELITSELDTFLAVTPEQIQAMVKKYMIPEKLAVLEIMPAPKEKK